MRIQNVSGLVVSASILLTAPTAIAAEVKPAHALARVSDNAIMSAEHNLTGVWERDPSPFEEGGAGAAEDMPPPRPGPNLKEPFAAEWKALRAKRQAALDAGKPLADSSTLCLPEGTPTIMQAIYPIQILQTPGQVTVLAELYMQTRRIYMNAPFPKRGDLEQTFYGFSSARWENKTLVVTTRGLQESMQFFEIPHSDQMVVTERYQITGPDKMRIDFSIEDPAYLKSPYHWTWRYKRNHKYRIPEYVCDHSLEKINPDGTVSFEPK
ncbi:MULTISPECIES: hypothetical protein [unclassified Novosphingobium]|uniref:hypothetical protein n=1 Tax=unclassified Novosphingobium TaxID=2644732 RepID=UPI000D4C0D3E|nr:MULTISPECIES: hypothetical protein [unclassified Novosphingobium]PTR07920.1 hypothetical protein C8K11_113132 [Novosphingobium sp. GV055]PUB00733.1 hypothetical protein C8K12_113132 [Novosphingobium sp. GV061]PUB16142.1 hypothetical protein C8K14_113132 [Novosphingobium sp. GV079]PUB39607.1 hypothetical protein C8K10_113132 [Novosphingobium sp. GV027]